jgi:hypothetical protein
MGLFVHESMGASRHPLDLWSKSRNLLDHSPPQYTHWKLRQPLSPFNEVTHDEKNYSINLLYISGMMHYSMNQI